MQSHHVRDMLRNEPVVDETTLEVESSAALLDHLRQEIRDLRAHRDRLIGSAMDARGTLKAYANILASNGLTERAIRIFHQVEKLQQAITGR